MALNKLTILASCAMLLPLCACSSVALIGAGMGVIGSGVFDKEDVNFLQRNYAVADYLIGQTKSYIERRDLILVEPLTDAGQPHMGSGITMLIPEQIGSRMSQLGYRVDLSNVASGNDSNYLKPAIEKGEAPDFIVTGTYTRQRKDIHVNMRVIDRDEGRVIGSFQYTLPVTSDTKALSTPQPQIIRLSDQP